MTYSDFDYDKLTIEQRKALIKMIAEDNKENSNKCYPDPITKRGVYQTVGKRMIDIIVSSAALTVSLPVNLIIALVTYADVGKPIFFEQQRMGKDGKLFTMVKFRNMTNETDENGVLLRADLRVTKWGRFVRSTSLDELLNFWNVFKGDMSLIGPRPLPIAYKGRFNKYHEIRHAVKPGLDCPLRDSSKLMTWENRLNNDAWYAQNVSLHTDLMLIGLLVKETLFGKDKKARASGFSEGSFVGYFSDGKVMDSNHIPEEYVERLYKKGGTML